MIECLIVLALISSIGFASVLLLTSLLNKNNLTVASETIINGIEFTQMAAMTYKESATFCGSRNHATCDGHWDDGQLTILAKSQILRHYPPLPATYQLIWRSSLGKNNHLAFTKEGQATQQGSLYLCKKKSGGCQMRIVLLKTGRIRIEQYP